MPLKFHDQRCVKCKKLLFRGLLGLGIVEVKCSRCGHVSMLHSFDQLLRSKTGAYVLVYNPAGRVIVTSASASEVLGYSSEEFCTLKIQSISPRNQIPVLDEHASLKALEYWQQHHNNLGETMSHLRKDGSYIEVNARFYPVASHDSYYTVGIYYWNGHSLTQ
jgi:PAS domain S-box-containing protein